MKKRKIFSKIFFISIFAIIVFIFIKILINANNLQLKITDNFVPILYQANHDPIKIFPKDKKNSSLNLNQDVYDFINNKEWKFTKDKNTSFNKERKVKNIIHNKKTVKKLSSNKDIINYKEHNIHIIKTESKKEKPAKKDYLSVQLGAFTTYNKANLEKKRLAKLFPYIEKQRQFIIDKALLKNNNFIYRLKIEPFSNINNAKNFCNNIRKKGIGCFSIIN